MIKKNIQIPLLVSIESRIKRLMTLGETVDLKRKEKIYLVVTDTNEIGKDSKINELLQNDITKYRQFFMNNVDYITTECLRVGEKIIVEFGVALFTITKIFYKNGTCIELGTEETNEELKDNLKCIEYSLNINKIR